MAMKRKRKNTTPRGRVFAVETVEGLLDWHQQNVRELKHDFEDSAHAAATWWASNWVADDMAESWSRKDYARAINRPGGFPTIVSGEQLADWLLEHVAAIREDKGDPRQEILQDLKEFWL